MTYQSAITALADPTRAQVFQILASQPAPVGQIATQLPVSRPAVSQHLKILSDAGLVTVRVEGTRRIYQAAPEGLAELRAWLDEMWTCALTSFAELAEREST